MCRASTLSAVLLFRQFPKLFCLFIFLVGGHTCLCSELIPLHSGYTLGRSLGIGLPRSEWRLNTGKVSTFPTVLSLQALKLFFFKNKLLLTFPLWWWDNMFSVKQLPFYSKIFQLNMLLFYYLNWTHLKNYIFFYIFISKPWLQTWL